MKSIADQHNWWAGWGALLAGMVALPAILLIDRWLAADERTLLQTGVVDESGHLLTALLLLMAVPGKLPARFVYGTLIGSVAIDVDHLPLILGSSVLTEETNRPFSHSLLSIAIVAALATIVPARWRWLAIGLAAGFAAHLWRDLATSSAGVPLLWPLSTYGYQAPYAVYIGSLIACLAIIALRGARERAAGMLESER